MSETTQKPILGTSGPNRLVLEGRIFEIRPPYLNDYGKRPWITRKMTINTGTEPRWPNPVVIEFGEEHRGILELLRPTLLVRVLVNVKTRSVDSGDYHDLTGFHVEALNKQGEWRVVPCNKAEEMPPNMSSETAARIAAPAETAAAPEEGDDLPF